VALRVDEGERHAPRAPDHGPSVDSEVRAQALHVRDQVVGGVGRQVSVGVTGQGPAAPAPSLVEDDRPVAGGVEVPPAAGGGRPSRPAVQPDRWETVRRADHLPVQGVAVTHLEVVGVVRLDGRVHGSIFPDKAIAPPPNQNAR
jgi:hypothetical protein